MLFLDQIWHIIVRIVGVLVFNPPTLPRWAWVTLTLIRTLVAIVLFRRNIAPFLLAKVTRRIRARSISPRSIRGLYFRSHGRTWRVERIGWAFHPWAENRLSIKIEDLRLDIAQPEPRIRRKRAGPSRAPLRMSVASMEAIREATVSMVRLKEWLWASPLFKWIRKIASSTFIAGARLFVRCLPALTQNVDFELESAVVSFAALSGAHVVIKGVTLCTKVDFSQLEKEDAPTTTPRKGRDGRGGLASRPWNSFFKDGADRIRDWERFWGQTEGFASVDITVREMAGYVRPAPPALPLRQPSHVTGNPHHSFEYPAPELQSPLDHFIRVEPVHFMVSSQFSPKLLTLQPHSLVASLEIPSIDVSADGLRLLKDLDKSEHDDSEDEQVLTPLASPGPWSGMSFNKLSPPSSPLAASPTSPSSPFMNTINQIARNVRRVSISSAAPVRHHKEAKAQRLFAALGSIKLRLPSIRVTHISFLNLQHSKQMDYVAGLDGFAVDFGLSDPHKNELHRKWLGSLDHSTMNGSAYNISCRFDMAKFDRLSSNEPKRRLRLLAVRELNVDLLLDHWPQPWIPAPKVISEDPNASFVACEASVVRLDLTERLDELRASIDHATPENHSSHPHASVPQLLSGVPRIEFRLVCGDVQARLACVDQNSTHVTSLLDVHNAGFNISLSTGFRTTKIACDGYPVSSYGAIQMDSTCCMSLQPIFLRASPTLDTKDGDEDGWKSLLSTRTESVEDDPLFSLDGVELSASLHTLGYLRDAENVSILPHTTMANIKCITDGLSIDLWKLECVNALRALLAAVQTPPTSTKHTSQSKLGWIYAGVSVHIALGCVTAIVTGRDINPACDLDLSRGLAIRTGLSLQYCCMQASRHSHRVKSRFSAARDRQQLGLPEDLLIQSMAVANTEAESDSISALLQGAAWRTSCRSAISTRYTVNNEYDASYDAVSEEKLQEGAFVSIPRLGIKVRLRRRRLGASTPGVTLEDSCDISTDVPQFQSRLDLLNAYSTLLVMRTLQSLMAHRRFDSHRARTPSYLRTTFRLRLENAHIICQFPVREQLFVRLLSTTLERRPAGIIKTECRSLVTWVPSVQVQGKWEELSRIRDVSVTLTRPSSGIKIAVTADGFRLAIPHRYTLSGLILDIGVTLKALRQLLRTVKLGHFEPISPPVAEAPKSTPVIDVHIGSLTLEAADSPFEYKLGLIWRTGFQAQKLRIERERAFEAKLRAILASGDPDTCGDPASQSDVHYHFTSKRTTSVADARDRLNMVHSNSWLSSIARQKEEIARKEDSILRQLRHASHKVGLHVPIPLAIHTPEKAPPLFRAVVNGLSLSILQPNLPEGYHGFLNELGGMPSSTEYSLMLPMHLKLSLEAARMNIRDYPLPLLNLPFMTDGPSLDFATNLIIAEEMGCAESVEWLQCPVVPENAGIIGAKAFNVLVPKTIMPVKSYASPTIHFCTTEVTCFTWGVSYNPAVQEVMRVLETLSHPPRDPSPAIGFWDKLRLVFHWRINAIFEGGARLHFKGSRDPYHVVGVGAGFDFQWQGHVAIKVGYPNGENELIQLTSDSLVISIPNHTDHLEGGTAVGDLSRPYSGHKSEGRQPSLALQHRNERKVCAKFSNGIRWGIGASLERTCGTECQTCRGDDFTRRCRFFTFVPHHQVVLRSADGEVNTDSYAGFRSNFIHFSTSLTSPLTPGVENKPNSFHLTPRTFAHFWSWWHLFDSALSLPIRQGNLFPESRPPSKKFGRHLATIKYRISFSPLYITHVYKIDNGDAWSAGESHCVGIKAFIEHFQADMHQREEETSRPRQGGREPQIIRQKPFSAVEVVITGLDLRALFAVFSEPQKRTIPIKDSLPGTTKFWDSLVPTPLSSRWVDEDDFVELDWTPADKEPNLYLYEAVYCPRFVYFKRTTRPVSPEVGSEVTRPKTKFGDEESHLCLMGKEPTAHEVQLQFGINRLAELRAQLANPLREDGVGNVEFPHHDSSPKTSSRRTSNATRETSLAQMIALLERYTNHLSQLRSASSEPGQRLFSEDPYDMPADIKLPRELSDFGNAYQIHCPKISLNNTTRNILQQYYLASRARRGFEYHMSARAVRFIRDQAHTMRASPTDNEGPDKRQRTPGGAQAAAQAVRRMLTGEERPQSEETRRNERPKPRKSSTIDPLFGWDKGVSERKAHLCLLLKPQIVLRSENNVRSVLVLAADHVVLRNYGILDTLNADDPVSGYVMQRNYADINSLQMFHPVAGSCVDHLPLEVFVDYRCESRDFDRLVPQTNATLRYDKFNRLRLHNNVATVAVSSKGVDMDTVDHLLHETDLIVVQVPRFSVSADVSAFGSISDVVTDLLLFSDPVHKARMSQLETMLFSYDFTDFASAARVVADLQSRIRQLIRIEGGHARESSDLDHEDLLATKAHILTLSQELNLIFDAIKLAQDKADERNQDKKSALCMQASSSEISWQMLDGNRELLAKLAVRGIDYSWLSRQDSSSHNRMVIGDLQAFDGSPIALWPEILAKHDEPPTHRMIRRGLFAEAQWSLLAPVGGITIYDYFEVELHPIRLAFETELGNKLLDYLIPERRPRRETAQAESTIHRPRSGPETSHATALSENPIHSAPQLTIHPPPDTDPTLSGASTPRPLTIRRARPIASRSFSNLRSATADSDIPEYHAPGIPKSRSSTALVDRRDSIESGDTKKLGQNSDTAVSKPEGDASEMRQRSAQKTFIHVKIPSVHVLLSVMKGRGFLVRDARLRTHDLEWRNQTWSFEELISHFIPSDPSWRGWVKVAWQQPVFSVGGVVKELITKTQWGRLGKSSGDASQPPSRSSSRQALRPALESQSRTTSDASNAPSIGSSGSSHPRSTSRPRMTSFFRRPDTRKSSVDSVDSLQSNAPASESSSRHRRTQSDVEIRQ